MGVIPAIHLIQWWAGALLVAAAVLAGGLAWWLARPRRPAGAAVPAANLGRIRALPAFRALVRQEWRRRRVELVSLVLAVAGAALLASRLVGVSDDAEELRTREVVLCLDVSSSMKEIDVAVIDSYLALVDQLDEERIGFVMFDAYAVTAFPLTTDHAYVSEQLTAAKTAIAQGQVPGTSAARVGSSLIGDGLATCVRHLDARDPVRSRTVVLATDNLVSGDAIYSVAQAGRLAEEAGVMVFGVMPGNTEPRAIDELRAAVRPTAGDIVTLEPGAPANVVTISSAIESQQKTALLTQAQDRSFDRIWPGALLLLAGLAGSLASVRRRP
ncbi:VWA domain-containing protein [Pimelobacter simplex]|uniref:VWA domain-containing protein n=1 Tax=Nocardioides simplex TaxID=2045 RepID=UPI003AAF3AD0